MYIMEIVKVEHVPREQPDINRHRQAMLCIQRVLASAQSFRQVITVCPVS
jgi:hypothetical protein